MRIRVILAGLVAASLLLSACGAQAPATSGNAPAPTTGGGGAISIRDPWVRAASVTGAQMPAATDSMTMTGGMGHGGDGMGHGSGGMAANGSTSAAYLTVVNTGGAPDAIVSAATDVADVVELHTVEMKDGVMQMRPVTQIDVPANGEVALKPGGFHIMLIGLKRDLKAGEMVRLTLNLQQAGAVEVEAPVRQP